MQLQKIPLGSLGIENIIPIKESLQSLTVKRIVLIHIQLSFILP